MRRAKLLVVVAAATLLACQPADLTRQELLQFQEQVDTRLAHWVEAKNNGQRDAVLAVYHEEDELLVMWPDGTVARGFEEQRRKLHDFFNAIRYMNFVPQQPRTEVINRRMAVTTFSHSTDLILQDSRREVRPGRGTIVWMRDPADDVWKIHIEHLSTNAPALN